jgi:hypothetical protein
MENHPLPIMFVIEIIISLKKEKKKLKRRPKIRVKWVRDYIIGSTFSPGPICLASSSRPQATFWPARIMSGSSTPSRFFALKLPTSNLSILPPATRPSDRPIALRPDDCHRIDAATNILPPSNARHSARQFPQLPTQPYQFSTRDHGRLR